MNLEEAQLIMNISEEEIISIKEYLNFVHTEINILGNFNSDLYAELERDGWELPKDENEFEELISHFVNVYSAMYKYAKENSLEGSFYRGTSRSNLPSTGKKIGQFLSTSRDLTMAQSFGNGELAVVTIIPDDDVPFLDAEVFRDENRRDESEVIFAPFCKAQSIETLGKRDVYTYYRMRISKSEFPEKSDEEITELRRFVKEHFLDNLKDIKQEIELSDEHENWFSRWQRAQDAENREFALKKVDECSESESAYRRKTNAFRDKLQELLMGLCKQRELQIDEAYNVIETERRRQEEENRNQVRADIKNTYLGELTLKLANSQKKEEELKSNIITQYERLQRIEEKYLMLARKLELLSTGSLSFTGIGKRIEEIYANLDIVRQELGNVQISDEKSYEEVCQTYTEINPVLDGVLYGLEISKDLSEIADNFEKRTEKELKKKMFDKVHSVVKDARVKKLLNEREDIRKEGVGWFGELSGKNDLQVQRVENIRLKIQLIQSEQPEEKQEYSIRDMLAEIKACAMSELGGEFTPEMEKIYGLILQNFGEEDGRPISEEEILELARGKVSAKQIALPVIQEKKKNRFFGTTKSQIELLKIENAAMREQVSQNARRSNMPELSLDTILEQEPLSAFELKLKGIDAATRNSNLVRSKNTDRTWDLFS